MKTLWIAFLFPAFAFASNQNITCYGPTQVGTLDLEFGGSEGVSATATIQDGSQTYEAALPWITKSIGQKTTTFKEDGGSEIEIAVPTTWLDKGFERSKITETVSFKYGNNQVLDVTECESSVD